MTMSAQPMAALEAAFLGLESRDVPFVHASILSFDRPIPLDALRSHIDTALAGIPRYRQRILRGYLGAATWVDDEDYQIEHHVHAAAVAGTGGPHELEELAACLLSSGLPFGHSPWRMWTVNDLADGRGAIIALFHHSLVDGVAGFRLLEHVLGSRPISEPARPTTPEPAQRTTPPVDGTALRKLFAWDNVGALAQLLRDGVRPAAQLGLNPRHTRSARAVASHTIELAVAKQIGRTLGGTTNDVVLATVASALRRFVTRRGVPAANLDDVRVMVPVSRHATGAQETSGNHVVLLLVKLPVDTADPVECLRRVAATTLDLKTGHSAAGGELLIALSQVTTPALLAGVLRVALRMRAFNLIVTNVPGPKAPLSLLGARLTRIVPIVNLWPHHSLGIAVASYAGMLTFGIQTDRAVIPDVEQFRDDLAAAFETLRGAAQREARVASLAMPITTAVTPLQALPSEAP